MGEHKNKPVASQPKLTYDQLSKIAADLSQQNQNLVQRLQQMKEALEDNSLNEMSFFLSMLFKVVDHKESYDPEFVKWVVANIQSILTAYATEKAKSAQPEEKKEEEQPVEKTEDEA